MIASKEMAVKRVDLGLQLSTAILIAFTAALVLLELSARFAVRVDNFDTLTF